jgi:hypothetical protein
MTYLNCKWVSTRWQCTTIRHNTQITHITQNNTPHSNNHSTQNYTNNKGHTTHNEYNANTITTTTNTIQLQLIQVQLQLSAWYLSTICQWATLILTLFNYICRWVILLLTYYQFVYTTFIRMLIRYDPPGCKFQKPWDGISIVYTLRKPFRRIEDAKYGQIHEDVDGDNDVLRKPSSLNR